MKPHIVFVCLGLLTGASSQAQFHIGLQTTPDSATVTVNGKPYCHSPCQVSYFWRQAVNGKMVVEVSKPGFKTWSTTVTEKPQKFDAHHNVKLEREVPKFELDSTSALIAFDRLLASFPDGTVVGTYIPREGSVEDLKWEGSVKIGDRAFESRFREVVVASGFRVPETSVSHSLFKGAKETRALPARYLVGVKLLGYRIAMRYVDAKDLGAGKVAGTTFLDLEWQVLDKAAGKVILTVPTKGSHQFRTGERYQQADHLGAFEDALVAFLKEGRFVQLVKETKMPAATTSLLAAPDSTLMRLQRRPSGQHKSLSEMLKFADQACVTVITEDGHGSGAVIDPEGLVLSAYHVVEDMNHVEVMFSSGLRQEARIVAFDIPNDVVLLDVAGSGYKALPLALDSAASLGDEVVTIGTPAAIELGQSVSKGIVSGKRELEERVYVQTDMAVSPGNSGGPLINMNGEIIGVIQSKVVAKGVEGIGFALPIARALEVLHLKVAP